MEGSRDPFASLPKRAAAIGVALSGEQAEQLRRHYEAVLVANRTLNLTRITDPEEAARTLCLVSLLPIAVLSHDWEERPPSLVLDLGTGAGYPGIPLAVVLADVSVVLVDARAKKVRFLEKVVASLGLANARAVHGRGRELSRSDASLRNRCSLVTARAIGSAAFTVGEAAGLLAPGGRLLVYKGSRLTDGEIREGDAAAKRAGLSEAKVLKREVEGLSPKLLLYEKR